MGASSLVVKELSLRIRLVKKELPKNEDSPAGLHRTMYYVQYISKDGFILFEREANSYDMEVFHNVRKADDWRE